ncbi:unnamed protein product [Calypogeia fissa]
MDRNRRLVLVSVSLFVWILFSSRTLFLTSAGHARRASQDLQENRVLAVRIGRFLLQHAHANTTNTNTNTTNAAAGGSHDSKLPVACIVVGSVAAAIAVLFLLLTAIGYFQNRWEVKVVDFQQHRDEGPGGMKEDDRKSLASESRSESDTIKGVFSRSRPLETGVPTQSLHVDVATL